MLLQTTECKAPGGLGVEVDGSVHNDVDIIKSDRIRQKDLEDRGYNVIRFSNQEVILNVKDVIVSIEKLLTGKN
ncbi:MAG: endonuclease domain-containing protein [Chitinophagaceae bacterium]